MSAFFKKIQSILSNRHVQYGVPFIALVVGSTFVLRELNTVRYEYRTVQSFSARDFEKAGIPFKQADPDQIYKEYMEKEYTDDYQMIRGPRPWEETPEASKPPSGHKIMPKVKRTFN